MQVNEEDFLSFLTTKQGLADNSIRLCRTRIGVINKWLGDKELTKENVIPHQQNFPSVFLFH